MLTVADPCADLERKVSQRIRDDASHRQVAKALTEVAMAALHPARHLGLGRAVSQGMLEDPIQHATHAAVEALIARLEDLVESLPPPKLNELVDEQLAAELGIE